MKLSLAMRTPVVTGIIDRRILLNFRCDPAVAARLVPPPFAPTLVGGSAMIGICLIRLRNLRPAWMPNWVRTGMGSENAAHRVAVAWAEGSSRREGVFVLQRHTDSVINTLAGGRLFPGVHRRARFEVLETTHRFKIAVSGADDPLRIRVVARVDENGLQGSVFPSLEAASNFFRSGSLGWSPGRAGELDGLELRSPHWRVEPLTIERWESNFFQDTERFPPGSLQFDNALLMRQVEHEWHSHEWKAPKLHA